MCSLYREVRALSNIYLNHSKMFLICFAIKTPPKMLAVSNFLKCGITAECRLKDMRILKSDACQYVVIIVFSTGLKLFVFC